MLKTRVLTAIPLVAGFLSALFLLPDVWWSLLILGVILVAAHEWSRLWSFGRNQEIAYLLSVAGLGAVALFALPARAVALPFYYGAVAFWFVAVPVWFYSGWRPVPKWIAAAVGWLILLSAWLAMIDLRVLGPMWLLSAMALVWVADIAAYFAGRAIGRHKLAPAISPGKTWEGVGGGLAGVLLYASVLIIAWHRSESALPAFDAYFWALWLGLALIMTGISVVGDLFESAVKRRAGVKDSGVLLPGHGGVLDRIDALLPVLPLAALIFARNQYASA